MASTRVMQWNVNGFMAHWQQLKHFFGAVKNKLHVLCVEETCLQNFFIHGRPL